MDSINKVSKPVDWPQNQREASLTNVYNYILNFKKSPTFHNKELLLALVNQDDLNQSNDAGLVRYSSYEIALINSVYTEAKTCNCNDAVMYLYRLLIRAFIQRKMNVMIQHPDGYSFEEVIDNDPYFSHLIDGLRFFYYTYAVYYWDNNESYGYKLIEIMNDAYNNFEEEQLEWCFNCFNVILYDLSFNTSPSIMKFANFSRSEIVDLYTIQSKIANKLVQNISMKTLSCVFCISLSNWLLKSRNNYNQDYIYKCISKDNIIRASLNCELWLKNIKYLNDPNEGKVSEKILGRIDSWKCKDWMCDEQFQYGRSYISSYTKVKPDKDMKDKYGDSWVAYKNDKIASSIAPILLIDGIKPFFAQVISFDVTYSEKEFVEEINTLGEIIDKHQITIDDKKRIFNDVLHYWRYSIKNEEEWSKEKERRYEIILFRNNEEYKDIEESDDYLKVKTFSVVCPDFCDTNNPRLDLMKKNKMTKLKIETKPFFFCDDCLYSDFDISVGSNEYCPICGSKKYHIVKRNNF